MASQPNLLAELIEALRCLPGVGAKSAQRMAFHLLERDRDGGMRLAAALQQAMQRRVRKSEILARSVPVDFRVTETLQRDVGLQLERNMRARVPQWGERTMRAPASPP